jgi:hypothetical protein
MLKCSRSENNYLFIRNTNIVIDNREHNRCFNGLLRKAIERLNKTRMEVLT